jgi:putative transcriptional regulator
MALKLNSDSASSEQIEAALCQELAELRLARNMTQQQLAEQAGVSLRTIKRLEAGEGTSLDTFIRLLKVLGISNNLEALIPDQSVRPLERAKQAGKQRQRARPNDEVAAEESWVWGDD